MTWWLNLPKAENKAAIPEASLGEPVKIGGTGMSGHIYRGMFTPESSMPGPDEVAVVLNGENGYSIFRKSDLQRY